MHIIDPLRQTNASHRRSLFDPVPSTQSAMKLSGITLVLFSVAPLVFGQAQTCTQEMIASDDCAAVIDANACYNEYRWNAQTLQCIDGKDNTDRQRKVSRSLLFLFLGPSFSSRHSRQD